MFLYLIRHAQSYNNSVEVLRRVCDPPLTELGQHQARSVADYIRHQREADSQEESFGFTKLFCSPMMRALETAECIKSAISVPVEVWPDLHETWGIWLDAQDGRGPQGRPGLTRSEIASRFPEYLLPDDLSDDGWWNRPPEIQDQWDVRAVRVAGRIQDEWVPAGANVALIVHAGFANQMLRALLLSGTPEDIGFQHTNTGITRLDFGEDGRIRLQYLNRQNHLTEGRPE